ncbi:MAG TPA: class I SAM-dependent methyltransferase [Prolixibacteraceae bacterium]|jgi:SAM-dependent methyltransferase|nr:class I SAM-dependent methyltransferase [Prolixibacteraceae bacterium]
MDKSEYLRIYQFETSYWWYRTLHELVDNTIRNNKPEGEIVVLDAGCGTGRMMEICQKYGTVRGIDYSPYAVYFARERGLKNVETGDLNNYPLENNTYDVVVCLDVLYHSALENDRAVIEKFYHTLKKGGMLIIDLPAFESLRRSHDIVVHTKKRYRKKALEKDLKEIGFTLMKSSYRLALLYFIILVVKLFQPKSQTMESKSDLKELPVWINTLLLNYGRLENWCIKQGFGFPVGSSLFAVAKKR